MKTATLSNSFSSKGQMPETAEEWNALDAVLRLYIRKYIYKLHLAHWQGGEPELVEDVLQETFIRALTYKHNKENRVEPSIRSSAALCMGIAKNYLFDLRRKDMRLATSIDNQESFHAFNDLFISPDPTEAVEEDDYMYALMFQIAQVVKYLPEKQRTAILIDIARRADFDDEHPSSLERAMRAVGIPLYEYRKVLPSDSISRSRHNALCALAYKRLRTSFAHESFDDVESPQQIQHMVSVDEQSTASIIREETIDDAPKEDAKTVLAEELSYINRLHEPYRQTVQLHYIEQWSYPAIANYLKLPLGTVKSHVSRGLKLLHILIQQKDTPMNNKVEQKKQEVLNNLHKLEGPCRKAVQLHYLEGRSYPEIAAELQVPLNTAKSYVHRGMKVLCA